MLSGFGDAPGQAPRNGFLRNITKDELNKMKAELKKSGKEFDKVLKEMGLTEGELRGHLMGPHPGFVARRAEALHPDIDQPAKLPGQVFDMDAGAPVDLRRVFPGQQVDTHEEGD